MQESHKDKQANKKNLEAMIFTQGLVRPKQTDKKNPVIQHQGTQFF